MIARIALTSNSDSNTEPTTIGVSALQFGKQNTNINTQDVRRGN